MKTIEIAGNVLTVNVLRSICIVGKVKKFNDCDEYYFTIIYDNSDCSETFKYNTATEAEIERGDLIQCLDDLD